MGGIHPRIKRPVGRRLALAASALMHPVRVTMTTVTETADTAGSSQGSSNDSNVLSSPVSTPPLSTPLSGPTIAGCTLRTTDTNPTKGNGGNGANGANGANGGNGGNGGDGSDMGNGGNNKMTTLDVHFDQSALQPWGDAVMVRGGIDMNMSGWTGVDSLHAMVCVEPSKMPPPPPAHPLTCEDRCAESGHCCTGLVSADQQPSCAMGCAIGEQAGSLQVGERQHSV